MHFLHAGRDLLEPLGMADALVRAIHKRPSADSSMWYGPDGQLEITLPTSSETEWQTFLIAGVQGRTAIIKALREDRLWAYVRNPADGVYMRIPRFYWFQDRGSERGEYIMQEVEAASGWHASMAGQPIVIPLADVEKWETVAQEARAKAASTPKFRHPSNMEKDDAPLLQEMKCLIESGEAHSRYGAAQAVANRAKGSTSGDSKARRLERRYKRTFGD